MKKFGWERIGFKMRYQKNETDTIITVRAEGYKGEKMEKLRNCYGEKTITRRRVLAAGLGSIDCP